MKHRIHSRIHLVAAAIVIFGMVLCLPGAAAADRSTAPGTFVGADLITEDANAAAKFYGELFDWDLEKVDDGFSIHHHGRLIASISQIEDDDPEVSRSFWLVGIVVNNLKGSISAAQKNGAEVVEKPKKVSGGYGTFAVIRDAEKAPLMLIQPGKTPVGGTKGPGAWIWTELWTDDAETAAQFYENVVGMAHQAYDLGDKPYHLFTSQGMARAGIIEIPDELKDVKPGWAPYIGVNDLPAAVAKVEKLGGRVVFKHTEHPVSGSVALILDPTGAGLFLFEIGSREEAGK